MVSRCDGNGVLKIPHITHHQGGSGLGLSICNKIANSLGGHINVLSEWRKGSRFIMFLPFEPFEGDVDGFGTPDLELENPLEAMVPPTWKREEQRILGRLDG